INTPTIRRGSTEAAARRRVIATAESMELNFATPLLKAGNFPADEQSGFALRQTKTARCSRLLRQDGRSAGIQDGSKFRPDVRKFFCRRVERKMGSANAISIIEIGAPNQVENIFGNFAGTLPHLLFIAGNFSRA